MVKHLRTKIFADGAELAGMLELYRRPYIKGFTTNPTLMRKAGVTDYRHFAARYSMRFRIVPSPSKCFRTNFPRWNGRHGTSLPGASTST
jgi:transaldolase